MTDRQTDRRPASRLRYKILFTTSVEALSNNFSCRRAGLLERADQRGRHGEEARLGIRLLLARLLGLLLGLLGLLVGLLGHLGGELLGHLLGALGGAGGRLLGVLLLLRLLGSLLFSLLSRLLGSLLANCAATVGKTTAPPPTCIPMSGVTGLFFLGGVAILRPSGLLHTRIHQDSGDNRDARRRNGPMRLHSRKLANDQGLLTAGAAAVLLGRLDLGADGVGEHSLA
jgi:hypothetical protein